MTQIEHETTATDEVAAAAGVAAATASEETHEPLTKYTLSNGIVLRIKPVPPQVVRDAVGRIPQPKIPTTFVEHLGRDEENPSDPEYIAALEKAYVAQADASQAVALILGTEIIFVPEGLQRPEDEEWAADVEFVIPGLEVPPVASVRARYLAWLRYYAIRTHEDMAKAGSAPLLLAGVSEEEVSAAVASFRSRTVGRTDNGRARQAGSGDGDHVPGNARDGDGDRGADSVPLQRVQVEGVDAAPED